MDLKSEKVGLRQQVIARILAMDPDERRLQESALIDRFARLPGLADARMVLLYVSGFPEEWATRPILQVVPELGKRLILPKVDRSTRTLRLFEVVDLAVDLQPGYRGILEPSGSCREVAPAAIDWVLVPGLAFNHQGYRLGRGAGYYDKLLPTLRPDAPRWALIFQNQWLEDLPIEPHDQPIDGVADFEKQVLRRGSRS